MRRDYRGPRESGRGRGTKNACKGLRLVTMSIENGFGDRIEMEVALVAQALGHSTASLDGHDSVSGQVAHLDIARRGQHHVVTGGWQLGQQQAPMPVEAPSVVEPLRRPPDAG